MGIRETRRVAVINLAEVELQEIRRRAGEVGGAGLDQLITTRFAVSELRELSAEQRRECLNLLRQPAALSEFSMQFQLPFMRRS